ncbi:MAG: virS [Clostridia bacterium]|nr:virS [Clostridia bacterium]
MESWPLWALIFWISAFIEWLVFKLILDSGSVPKIGKKIYIIFFISMVGIETMLNLWQVIPSLKACILIVLSCCFGKLAYKISWVNNLLAAALFWMLALGSESLVMGFIIRFWHLENHMLLLEYNLLKLVFIILAKGLLISGALIYKRFKISIQQNQYEIIYIVMPLATNSLVLLFIFGYAPIIDSDTQRYYLVAAVMTLLIILANISLIIIMRKMTREYQNRLADKSYQDKQEAEYNYYMQLEKEHEKIRQLYHDMNNHMACMIGLAENHQELSPYLQELQKEMSSVKQVFHTGSKVVDTLLRQKSLLCEKEDIAFQVGLDLKQCSFVTDQDLCSIFGNALQFLVIKIKNTKAHTIKQKSGQLITHKKDSFLHGLGLKNIQRCLDKYEGEMVVDYTESEFYLKIVLPLPPSNDILDKNCIKV